MWLVKDHKPMVKEQLEQGKVQAVWSNQTAFLALLQNGQVLAWGESSGSGDITRSFKPDRYAQVGIDRWEPLRSEPYCEDGSHCRLSHLCCSAVAVAALAQCIMSFARQTMP